MTEPGKGFHVHVCGVAIFDVIGTVLVAYALALLARGELSMATATTRYFIALFVLGQVLHWYFGIQTAFLTAFDVSARPRSTM